MFSRFNVYASPWEQLVTCKHRSLGMSYVYVFPPRSFFYGMHFGVECFPNIGLFSAIISSPFVTVDAG